MRTKFLVATALAAAAVLLALTFGGRSGRVVSNLVTEFPSALKRPGEDHFKVQVLTLKSRSESSIVVRGSTRLTYHVTVPTGGRFRVAVALVDPEQGGPQKAGLVFSIGISDGHAYRVRKTDVVNASGEWVDWVVNLTEFESMTVDLILNTREGPESGVGAGTPAGAWGSPVIEAR